MKKKTKVFKLNTEENSSTARIYMTRSIPNLIIFKGWLIVDMLMDAVLLTKLANT